MSLEQSFTKEDEQKAVPENTFSDQMGEKNIIDRLLNYHDIATQTEQGKIAQRFLEASIRLKKRDLVYEHLSSQGNFLPVIMKTLTEIFHLPEMVAQVRSGHKLNQLAEEGILSKEQVDGLQRAINSLAVHKKGEEENPRMTVKEAEANEIYKKGLAARAKQALGVQAELTPPEYAGAINDGLESFSSSVGEDDPNEPGRINEDQVLERPDKGVYAVFDGAGGHEKGDVASYVGQYALSKLCDEMPANMSLEDTQQFIKSAIEKISRNIFENNQIAIEERGELSDMASTMTLAVVWNGPSGEKKLVVGNVGDSRAYLRNQGRLEQLTIDDNYLRKHAGDDARARRLQPILNNLNSEEDINGLSGLGKEDKFLLVESFRNRNVITKHLGMENPNPDITVHDFPAGAELLLTTDGVTDNLTDKEIEQNFGSRLGELAVKRSGENHGRAKPDDTTFALVKNLENSKGDKGSSRPYEQNIVNESGLQAELLERIKQTSDTRELYKLKIESLENIFKRLKSENNGVIDESILYNSRFYDLLRSDDAHNIVWEKLQRLGQSSGPYDYDAGVEALAHVMFGQNAHAAEVLDFSKIVQGPYSARAD